MSFTTADIKKFFGIEIDDAILCLLTITHDQIEPLRVVNNAPADDGANDIVSRGETYIAFPFEPVIASDNEGPPTASLRIANTDRRISESLLNLTSSPDVALEIVTASEPDRPLLRFARFQFTSVSWGSEVYEGQLVQTNFSQEPYPNKRVVPSLFPALFR